MLSAAITHHILTRESPQSVQKVTTVLEKHPCYANQWQARLQDVSIAQRDLVIYAGGRCPMIFASGRPDPNFHARH